MKDKRQQAMILQRKRGELYKAVRNALEEFNRLKIKAEVFIPEGKDRVAYLLIDEESLANFFTRRLKKRLREIDKNIEVKTYYETDVMVIYVRSEAEASEEEIKKEAERTKEELAKMDIKAEVMITKEYFTKTYILIDFNSVINFFDNKVKEKLKKTGSKVNHVTYREDNVLVVRFSR